MIQQSMANCLNRIEIIESENLTVKQTKALNATHIVRGLRAVTDFEYEIEMAHANRVLDKSIDSIYFMTDNKYIFLSSSTVKEIATFEGDLTQFVPKYVAKKLIEKMK
jgi:pantetheine-phosphate adenylyltransferase